MLEWPEQPLGTGYSAARVAKLYDHSLLFDSGVDGQLTARLVQKGAFAVLGEVEEDLHQTLPVGPDHRQALIYGPSQLDVFFPQRRLHHDSQFPEQRLQIDTGRLVGGLTQI